MLRVVLAKFGQDGELGRPRYGTGDAALIEGDTWHYQYRGRSPVRAAVLPGVGRELPRHILEAVRLVLRWTDGMPPVQLARLKTCSIKRSGYRDLVLSGEASAQYTSGLAKVHWVSPAEAGTLMVGMHTPTPVPRWLCHAVKSLGAVFHS